MKKFLTLLLSCIGVTAFAVSPENQLNAGIVFEPVGEPMIEVSDQKVFVRFKLRVSPFNNSILVSKKQGIEICLKEKDTGAVVAKLDGLYEKPYLADFRGSYISFAKDKNTMFLVNAFGGIKGLKPGNYYAEISNISWKKNGITQEFKPFTSEKFQTSAISFP